MFYAALSFKGMLHGWPSLMRVTTPPPAAQNIVGGHVRIDQRIDGARVVATELTSGARSCSCARTRWRRLPDAAAGPQYRG